MKELKFAGIGGAFDTSNFASSAFYEQDDTLIIFDVGGGILRRYKELIEKGKINIINIKNIYICTSHLHGDHVGDLGSLIFYFTFVLKIQDIQVLSSYKLRDKIIRRMKDEGVIKNNLINVIFPYILGRFEIEGIGTIHIFKTKHVKNIKSYGFVLEFDSNDVMVFSGDTKEFILYNKHCNKILDNIDKQKTSGYNFILYQEVTLHSSVAVHTQLTDINKDSSNKVVIYHFNPDELNDSHKEYIENKNIKIAELY